MKRKQTVAFFSFLPQFEKRENNHKKKTFQIKLELEKPQNIDSLSMLHQLFHGKEVFVHM
jgi:hypothetical protein